MSNVKKLKTHDRQTIVQNLVTAMKKRYRTAVPKRAQPVLETLLYAAVLENACEEEAASAFDRLMKAFHDLNEIRVSSVTEIEAALHPLPNAGWPALRIREILQYTFEKHFRFDLDELKRKPLEQVEKTLTKFKYLTPFMKLFLLQNSLGSHVIALDDKSRDLLAFLGVVEPLSTIDSAADDLKHIVRKADAALFCHLVRGMASDSQYKGKLRLTPNQAQGEGPDATTAVQRLTEIFNGHTPKTPPGPSQKSKADDEKEEPLKGSGKKSAKGAEAVAKVAPPPSAGTAKPAAKPTSSKGTVATKSPPPPSTKAVKKPVDKKAPARKVGEKPKTAVTKKVSKPQAAAGKKPARKK